MLTADGWVRTGDIGYFNQDGFLFLKEAMKDFISYKDFKISPSELENLLLTHDDVRDAAVAGKPDAADGHLLTAFVVVVAEKRTAEAAQEIAKFVKERVDPSKELRGGVHFVHEIPRNPIGRILRKNLIENL